MKKVLIATYSWSGRTAQVADKLTQLLDNADNYNCLVGSEMCIRDRFKTDQIATAQIKSNQYPELTNPVPDVSQYDLILIGSPVWRGAPATPVHTFLDQIQGYTGKIASFYTDAGSANDYEETFKQWAGDLNVLPAHEGTNDLKAWLQELN